MPQTLSSQRVQTVELIRRAAAFDAMESWWDTLAGDVPFRRWTWNRLWWKHYAEPSDQLMLLVVRDEDGEAVAIAPWFVSRTAGRGRVARFLGSGEVCADYVSILCGPELRDEVANALAEWLVGPGAKHWDLLELTGVHSDDDMISRLTEALSERGHKVVRQGDMNCWRIALPSTWDEYTPRLSRSRRERTRMLFRRNFGSGRAVVRSAETEDDWVRGFDILIDLHQKRRQSLGEKGCFASSRFDSFHRELSRELFREGNLRLLWLEIDGRPAAVEYSFIGGDTLYFYQSGFEPELGAERPGWIGVANSIQSAIEQGYRNYDFLRGDEPYKASWGAQPQSLIEVHVVGRSAGARVRHAAWQAGATLAGCARRAVRGAQHGTARVLCSAAEKLRSARGAAPCANEEKNS